MALDHPKDTDRDAPHDQDRGQTAQEWVFERTRQEREAECDEEDGPESKEKAGCVGGNQAQPDREKEHAGNEEKCAEGNLPEIRSGSGITGSGAEASTVERRSTHEAIFIETMSHE